MVVSLAVKQYDSIYPKNDENTRLNSHLCRIDFTIQGSKAEEYPSWQEKQPLPYAVGLYCI
jgi:hypothetical protein